MIRITSWLDLDPFGIHYLTGEACGLSYRALCDVTIQGKAILEKLWGIPDLQLADNWNTGTPDDPHIGSIMLTRDLIQPIAVFALLESGISEVWLLKDGAIWGVKGGCVVSSGLANPQDRIREHFADKIARVFTYGGTAGDRNTHEMSGRIA